MITGFNTDIKHEGVTYHVQTEDKGLKTPLILSLVYQGGTILASKRSPYEDLVVDFDEKVLEVRLNRQHNLICAAIRAGRIEDLKRMTLEASSNKEKQRKQETAKTNKVSEVIVTEIKREDKIVSLPITDVSSPKVKKDLTKIPPIEIRKETESSGNTLETGETKPEIEVTARKEKQQITPKEISKIEVLKPLIDKEAEAKPSQPIAQDKVDSKRAKPKNIVEPEIPVSNQTEKVESQIPKPVEEPVWDIPIIEDATIIEEGDINDEVIFAGEIILPPDAVEIIGDLEQFGSLLEDELKVKILGENPFKSGDRKNVNILVCRGSENSAVADASVMVKVIGSDFRPLIYHAKADSNGVASVFLKLPAFRSGRAALLIRAMVDGEETELRRAISPI